MKCGIIVAVALLSLSILPAGAEAKGCLKGAAVGGVAGHMVGSGHAAAGAAAGCAIGHHKATKDAKQAAQRNNTGSHNTSDDQNSAGDKRRQESR